MEGLLLLSQDKHRQIYERFTWTPHRNCHHNGQCASQIYSIFLLHQAKQCRLLHVERCDLAPGSLTAHSGLQVYDATRAGRTTWADMICQPGSSDEPCSTAMQHFCGASWVCNYDLASPCPYSASFTINRTDFRGASYPLIACTPDMFTAQGAKSGVHACCAAAPHMLSHEELQLECMLRQNCVASVGLSRLLFKQ